MRKRFLFFISIIVPFLMVLKPIIAGNIPFWNDPARDLLLAWDNLKKPTLIGPTSGIPGIFYGPHWIWILSGGLVSSKDPRWVVFLTTTIPYFVIFPYIIYQLSKDLFTKKSAIILWLLFIFAFVSYTNQIWSPNLAPLFFLCLIFIFYKTEFILERKNIRNFFLLGFILGLLLNHLISFGVGLTFSFGVYFLITLILSFFQRKNRQAVLFNWFLNTVAFTFGFILILSPFFIFELRHGFSQLKSLFFTLNKAFIHNSPVVDKIGLSKTGIIIKSFEKLNELLSFPKKFTAITSLIFIGLLTKILLFEKTITKAKKKLIVFILLNYFGVMIVYLTSRNPIWDYHFIGFEIIFLILLGILIKRFQFLEKLLLLWVITVLIINTFKFLISINKKTVPELLTKKINVEKIYRDAQNNRFGYYGKNAAIYTFDYDYMFRWVGESKDYVPIPNSDNGVRIVYLIIPYELRGDKIGFTENRTPAAKYKTIKEWRGNDKTIFIRRELRD